MRGETRVTGAGGCHQDAPMLLHPLPQQLREVALPRAQQDFHDQRASVLVRKCGVTCLSVLAALRLRDTEPSLLLVVLN